MAIASQQRHLRLQLFMHQGNNQVTVVSCNGFGTLAVNDWTVHEGPSVNSKIVARAQGHHAESGLAGEIWYTSLSMVFEDGSYKGSTLQVMGMMVSDGEWSIVGGTGKFMLAQGVIRKAFQPNIGLIKLDIYALYYDIKDGAWPWDIPQRDTPENLRLQLYLRHDPNNNQVTVVSPNGSQGFGAIVVNDWTVHEGPSVDSKIIARAQGHHAQSSMAGTGEWYGSFSMVFEDDRYKGSSLQVMGTSVHDGEWAIVGGTGKFMLAQGVIRKTNLERSIGLIKMDIYTVYYDNSKLCI
ncbi:unnamed protein product [Urochloa humidicola]